MAISGVCALIVTILFALPTQQLSFGAPMLSLFKNATTTGLTADYICLGGTCASSFSAGTQDGTFSTTSAIYFVHSSTTIPKTYTSNTFSLLNTFANSTSTLFSATTAWIGTLNLTNALTIGNGGTGLSAIGASSTVLTTNGTAAAWQKIALAAAVYGTLPVVNGGTGLTTFGGTNHVLYTSAADTLTSEAALTYLATGDLLTMVNASTTNMTVAASLFLESVRQSKYQYVGFTYSTTTWVGTTTVLRTLAPFAGTLQDMSCDLTAGTLNAQVFVNSTAVTAMFSASTTAGTVTFSANNTFVKGDTLQLQLGTPASTPVFADCTARSTVTTP